MTCAPECARVVLVCPGTACDNRVVHLGRFQAHVDQYGSWRPLRTAGPQAGGRVQELEVEVVAHGQREQRVPEEPGQEVLLRERVAELVVLMRVHNVHHRGERRRAGPHQQHTATVPVVAAVPVGAGPGELRRQAEQVCEVAAHERVGVQQHERVVIHPVPRAQLDPVEK